ncbi:hypothetical protein B0J13DRAFT_630152 [Dactylonectria estremocensis]|uniref:GST N-terminal domain-containing protein n=1 Tax=Dactylonectria estremocensis TaxID=1079267 RepID=A0A9P9DDF1_9HYPO|nr:hypothetical protein B0J13DRAFT_630152 [Dactylonectria estremocensis]
MAVKTKTDITLYTEGTPVVSRTLKQVHPTKMMDNEQKESWFLKINPNGRIPAITDTFTDGEQLRVFESGAILEYLASYPRNTWEHWETTSWLMWQMGGLGPMQGQANHFKRYAPERRQWRGGQTGGPIGTGRWLTT